MIFCGKCGNQLTDIHKFCTRCGSPNRAYAGGSGVLAPKAEEDERLKLENERRQQQAREREQVERERVVAELAERNRAEREQIEFNRAKKEQEESDRAVREQQTRLRLENDRKQGELEYAAQYQSQQTTAGAYEIPSTDVLEPPITKKSKRAKYLAIFFLLSLAGGAGTFALYTMYWKTPATRPTPPVAAELNPDITDSKVVSEPLLNEPGKTTDSEMTTPAITESNINAEPVNQEETAETTVAAEDNVTYHTVQPGETLYRISVVYKVSVEQLREWNNFSDNTITVGQKMIVGY